MQTNTQSEQGNLSVSSKNHALTGSLGSALKSNLLEDFLSLLVLHPGYEFLHDTWSWDHPPQKGKILFYG